MTSNHQPGRASARSRQLTTAPTPAPQRVLWDTWLAQGHADDLAAYRAACQATHRQQLRTALAWGTALALVGGGLVLVLHLGLVACSALALALLCLAPRAT